MVPWWVQRDHCSDYSLHAADGSQILEGHNEDGGVDSVNNTFILHATIDNVKFSCYVYAGDLYVAFPWVSVVDVCTWSSAAAEHVFRVAALGASLRVPL